jgi:hypothetical protein
VRAFALAMQSIDPSACAFYRRERDGAGPVNFVSL